MDFDTFLVRQDECDCLEFILSIYEQGFVKVFGDGNLVGADGFVLLVLQERASGDVQFVVLYSPITHLSFKTGPDAAVK